MKGRHFGAEDRADSAPVVMINQRLAKELWGDKPAVGRRIRFWGGETEVVGVTADVKQLRLEEEAPPTMFRPLSQSPQIVAMSLFVRTIGEPLAFATAVRDTVWDVDPRVPVSNVHSLDQVIAQSIVMPRLLAQVLGAFALLALVLLVGGIFGVVSYLVSRRTHEIGVKMALGARPGQILEMVMAEGLGPVVVGALVGLAGVLGLSRFLEGLLFDVAPRDPFTLAWVLVLLVLAAAAACYLPARRATRVDPTVALRCE